MKNQVGFGIFRILSEDHGILVCSQYEALEDPKNRTSDFLEITLDSFTGAY